MSMHDVSVFGSTGFIGKKFCELSTLECVEIDREVRVPKTEDSIYFISTTHNYHVFDDLKKDINTNLIVLMETLENLRKSDGVFNFISSWFVYGDIDIPKTEDAHCHPKGFYSITKYTAEELLKSFCETFGIRYRILRLCNVYGAEDAGVSQKKNALQYLINEIRDEKPINLYYDGIFYRDYMHVDDVCRAIDLCIQKGPLDCVINIGSGDKILFRDIIEIARSTLGSRSKINNIEPPKFHKTIQVKNFYMDTSKLKSLGFMQKISLDEGIRGLCRK